MSDLSFEEALERLEQVVRQLESGQLPLEQGLSAYEEGMQLARLCQQRLDDADSVIERLTREAAAPASLPQG
ncbi:MAG: exodeoxyribonuclease VII small subunit [Magnetococcus sp. WYHC-3]